MNKKPLVFLDQIGRTVIGIKQSESDTDLFVENPALLLVNANPQTNQLQLQILPLFFKKFQSEKNSITTWLFKKTNITTSEDIELSPQLLAQYNQLFGNAASSDKQEEPKVVKLFDEE